MSNYQRYKRGSTGSAPRSAMAGGLIAKAGESGYGELAKAVSGAAKEIYRIEAEKQRVEIGKRMAAFQLEDDQILEELRNAPYDAGSVDELYAASFDQRRKAVMDSAPNSAYARQLDDALTSIYLRGQMTAQRLEVDRSREQVATSIQEQIDMMVNSVRSHPSRLEDSLVSAATSIESARGMLPPDEIDKMTKAAKSELTYAAASAQIETDPYSARKALSSGKYDSVFTPQVKDRLVSQADREIKARESQERIIQNQVAIGTAQQIAFVEKELQSGVINDTSVLKEMARGAGDKAPALLQRIDIIERTQKAVAQFSTMSAIEREGEINKLQAKRFNGGLSENEAFLLGVLESNHTKMLNAAEDDGVQMGLMARILDETNYQPLSLDNPETFALRESIAPEMQARFGGSVALTDKAELDWILSTLQDTSTPNAIEERKKMIAALSSAPSIRNHVIANLKDKNTAYTNQLSVALESDPNVSELILRGSSMLKKNAAATLSPDDRMDAIDNLVKSYKGGINREQAAIYVDAANAYSHAKLEAGGDYEGSVDIEASIEEILPGRKAFGHLITPSKAVDESKMRGMLDAIEAAASTGSIPPYIAWYDDATESFIKPSLLPSVSGRFDIPPSAYSDPDNLYMIQPGVYEFRYLGRPLTGDVDGAPAGSRLVIDLRGEQ